MTYLVEIGGWGALECETLASALSCALQAMQAPGTWRWEATPGSQTVGISTSVDRTNIDGVWRNLTRGAGFKSIAITVKPAAAAAPLPAALASTL